LSPLIFSLVIDWVPKTTMKQLRGIQWTLMQRLEDLDFADDVSLLSHMVVQVKATRLYNIARTAGLEINVTKARSVQINASQEAPLTVDGQSIKTLIASPTCVAL